MTKGGKRGELLILRAESNKPLLLLNKGLFEIWHAHGEPYIYLESKN